MTEKTRELPDGTSLSFTDNGRSRMYRHHPAEGKPVRLVSATTVLDCLSKPALIRWAEDHGARGAIRAWREGEVDADTPEDEIVERVRFLGLGADAAKKKAAKRGLNIHDGLELWATTGDFPNPADMDPDERPYLRGLVGAVLELDPEPMQVEEITCSVTHGFAGRFDLRARVRGQDLMLDLKTTTSGWPYGEAHLQIAGYMLAEEECGTGMADGGLVIAVGPDGTFNTEPMIGEPRDFLDVLRVYRTRSRIAREQSAIRKLAEAQRQAA